MGGKALYVRLEAKPGREDALAALLRGGAALVEQEPGTVTWFALQMGPTTFGIFDTFNDEQGRQDHLSGVVAAALMDRADDLLVLAPTIDRIDVLAEKLP